MAVYDLEEQEQISELKAWWEQYGKLITTIAVVAALASVGWQGLRWYQANQAAEAGALYFAVQQAAERGDAQKAREAAGQIIGKFSGSAYADMAALVSAGVQFTAGDIKNARAQLEWLVAEGNDPVLRDIGRLRLAAVLLDEGAYSEALAQLEKAPVASLKARFEDLRGDVLAADGKTEQARAAYEAALAALGQTAADGSEALRGVVRVKLQALES
jgi:predicted negative regulator of RcsB-dependent stress response